MAQNEKKDNLNILNGFLHIQYIRNKTGIRPAGGAVTKFTKPLL